MTEPTKERVLYRDDGVVFSYTKTLAARKDMTPGLLGDSPPTPTSDPDADAVEPAEIAEMGLPIVANEPLTPELLDRMDKSSLLSYTLTRYGKSLDKRRTIERLRSDLWAIAQRKAHEANEREAKAKQEAAQFPSKAKAANAD